MNNKLKILLYLICLIPLSLVLNCGNKAPKTPYIGQDIITEFLYKDTTYRNTGQTIATQEVNSSSLPNNISYIGSFSYQNSDYEIYSIQGISQDQSIAIKFTLCHDKSCYYCYFKFESINAANH
jgi:hypothetical protein